MEQRRLINIKYQISNIKYLARRRITLAMGGSRGRVPDSAQLDIFLLITNRFQSRTSTGLVRETTDRTPNNLVERIHSPVAGQMLIELMIAIGLTTILLPALLTGIVASREGKASESQRLETTALLKEAEEAVRSVRESGWANFATNGTYHPEISGTSWSLVASSQLINGYTRQVIVSDAQRDASGQIVETGGNPDTSTKKVVSTVSWNTPFPSKVESTSYFQRYLGNAAFTETTQADFADGAHNNTVATSGGPAPAGAVELTQSASTSEYGNKFLVTAISGIGIMSRTSGKTSLRFTAQASKTVNAVRVFVHTRSGTAPTYRFGIQTNNPVGNIPSGTWVGGQGIISNPALGWRIANLSSGAILTAGQTYHLVVEYASGTQTGSISLRRSAPLNLLYPQTQAADPQSNTLFTTTATFSAASIQNFQPIYELDFSDSTFEGNPYESSTEIPIFGSNFFGEKFRTTPTAKTALDVSFYARRNGTPTSNLQVVLFNADTNTSIEEGIIATPGIGTTFAYQKYTFTIPRTLEVNTNYRIYLKSPASTSANHYRVYRLNTSTFFTNLHSITYDGTNSIHTISTNAGATWNDNLNAFDIGGFFFTIQGASTYASSGDFTSHASGSFDAGATVAFNNLTWNANTPVGTTLRLQAAISSNPAGPFDYFGSDGAIGSYFTSSGQIPLNRINGRYLRYRATFTSDGSTTPTLNDVSISYSP